MFSQTTAEHPRRDADPDPVRTQNSLCTRGPHVQTRPPPPPPHSLTPLAATDLFCFYNFVIVTFYNWDQMVPNHLGLTVYTQCNALAIHPGCHVCQQFYGEVVFIPRCGGVTAGLPTPLLKGVWVVSSLGPLWRSV